MYPGMPLRFPRSVPAAAAASEIQVSASKSTGKKVVHTRTNAWDIPYCRSCLIHVNALRSAHSATVLVIVLSMILAGILAYVANGYVSLAVAVAGLVGAMMIRRKMVSQARAQCSPQCAAVAEAIRYLGWHGSLHQFDPVNTVCFGVHGCK